MYKQKEIPQNSGKAIQNWKLVLHTYSNRVVPMGRNGVDVWRHEPEGCALNYQSCWSENYIFR